MTDTLHAPPVGGDREKVRPTPLKTENTAPDQDGDISQTFDHHIAWIPCVSGELFFSETAHGLGLCDRYLFNTAFYTDEGQFQKRLIVSTALVSWQDTKFTTQPLKGLYRVFFIAESNSHDWLEADVFLVEKNRLDGVSPSAQSLIRNPSMYWPRANDEQELQALEAIEKLIDNNRDSLISEAVPSKLSGTEALIENINDNIEKIRTSVVHRCTMHIHCSGISEVRFSGTKKIDGSDYVQSPSGARLVATQVFYYAKYLLHKHTHHSSENDSLTTAHLIKATKQENADVLVRDLKRALVCGQRSSRKEADHTAKGIAQYGKALITSCSALGLFSEDAVNGSVVDCLKVAEKKRSKPDHQRYMDILGNSAQITQDRNKNAPRYSALSNLINGFKGTALLLLAIIGPLLLFLNIMVFAEYSQRIKAQQSVSVEQPSYLASKGTGAYEFNLLLFDSVEFDGDMSSIEAFVIKPSSSGLLQPTSVQMPATEIEQQFQKLESRLCRFSLFQQSCKNIVSTLNQYAQADIFALLKILATLLLLSLVAAACMLEWGKVNLLGTLNKKLVKLGTYGSTHRPIARMLVLPITMLSLYIAQARIALLTPKRGSGLMAMSIALTVCFVFGGYLVVAGFGELISATW